MATNLTADQLTQLRAILSYNMPSLLDGGTRYQVTFDNSNQGADFLDQSRTPTGYLRYQEGAQHQPGQGTYSQYGTDGTHQLDGTFKSTQDMDMLLLALVAAGGMGFGLPALMGSGATAGTGAGALAGATGAGELTAAQALEMIAAEQAAAGVGTAAAAGAGGGSMSSIGSWVAETLRLPSWAGSAINSLGGSVVSSLVGGGGGSGTGGGTTGGRAPLSPVQLAYLLRTYDDARDDVHARRDTENEAASRLEDRTSATIGYTDDLAGAARDVYGRIMSRGALPSQTGAGLTGSYAQAARSGPDVDAIARMAMEDRGNMLDQYGRAVDAANRRVDIGGYTTLGVRDRADQIYSGLVGGVDRAAAIAGSQGFAKALGDGMADSTAAATTANNLAREFGDVYSKLRVNADQQALSENQENYKSYLSGKTAEVDQNSKLGALNNQLYSAASNAFQFSGQKYMDASTSLADRLMKALGMEDEAALKSQQLDQNLMGYLLNGLTDMNRQSMDAGWRQYNTAAQATAAAQDARGRATAKLIDSNWGSAFGDSIDSLIRGLFGGSASGGSGGSTPTAGDQEGDYPQSWEELNSWWAGSGDGMRGTSGDQEGDFPTQAVDWLDFVR